MLQKKEKNNNNNLLFFHTFLILQIHKGASRVIFVNFLKKKVSIATKYQFMELMEIKMFLVSAWNCQKIFGFLSWFSNTVLLSLIEMVASSHGCPQEFL